MEMQVSFDQLMTIVGRKEVELQMMSQRLSYLQKKYDELEKELQESKKLLDRDGLKVVKDK
uniref:Uncharacterized protein n=1 Tax=viral metagenome TaxID=1070528 RepID=A0A6M3J920_9ZZZZ